MAPLCNWGGEVLACRCVQSMSRFCLLFAAAAPWPSTAQLCACLVCCCPQTFDKKKLTSKLTFPEVLTLDPALQAAGVPPDQWPATPLGPLAEAGSSGPGALYDLQAVLLHKGNSASHGHYGETPC
jgi:hypothetical protein